MKKKKDLNSKDLSKIKSFFSGNALIDPNNFYHFSSSPLEDIINEKIDNAVRERFRDMEFSEGEDGEVGGIKNRQEMLLTVANDIAEDISNEAYELAQKLLAEDDTMEVAALEVYNEIKDYED